MNFFLRDAWLEKKKIIRDAGFNPLNTNKLRINATFRQQMAFFGQFRPNFVPILKNSAF